MLGNTELRVELSTRQSYCCTKATAVVVASSTLPSFTLKHSVKGRLLAD